MLVPVEITRSASKIVVVVLHRTATGRFHPACFSAEISGRRRSIGHHTEGFSTRLEALAVARNVAETLIRTGCATECLLALDTDIGWDGEGLPAMQTSCETQRSVTDLIRLRRKAHHERPS